MENNDSETERVQAQLRCMLSSSQELAALFHKCVDQTEEPRIRDEFQKLCASAENHVNRLRSMIGEVDV